MFRLKLFIYYMVVTFVLLCLIFRALDFSSKTSTANYMNLIRRDIYKEHSTRSPVTVLLWSTLYGKVDHWNWWFAKKNVQRWCPEELDCTFTMDKRLLNQSDAVLFHGYSEDLNRSLMPSHRHPHQRWIYVLNESPHVPLRNLSEYDNLFNWTLTYRRDSDIYGGYGEILLKEENAAVERVDYPKNKTRLIAWFVSHCHTSSRREDYVKELQKYIPVDVYGKCGNGIFKCKKRYSHECFKLLEDHYKFYLAFENHICTEYITEKFFGILRYYIVPVVLGGDGYDSVAPQGSYINALDFETPKQLADYLLLLNKNSTLYNEYFNWKRGKKVKILRWEKSNCDLCRKLRDKTLPIKVYKDLNYWWNTLGNCKRWENGTLFLNQDY